MSAEAFEDFIADEPPVVPVADVIPLFPPPSEQLTLRQRLDSDPELRRRMFIGASAGSYSRVGHMALDQYLNQQGL